MAKLIFIGEKFSGRVYEIAVEKTTVGRGDQNTLTIPDGSVSHSHCEILVYGTEVIVRDLGSSNGTFVNGVRLHDQQRPLLAGQTVRFGSVEARLELESTSTSDTVTDVTAVYSHARHLRGQNEPKPGPPPATTFEAGSPPTPAEHTLILPRRAQTTERNPLPSPARNAETGKSSRTAMLAFVVAAMVIGLAAICWLILARNR